MKRGQEGMMTMDDTVLDLRHQYQDDLLKTEQDYQQRRMDIQQDYCRSVEKSFQVMTIDIDNLISAYVSMTKASPFWNPL